MSVFSLEEDDCESLFITQSSMNSGNSQNNDGILGDPMDFSSPCASVISRESATQGKYSDISDDDFEIPCSQKSANICR